MNKIVFETELKKTQNNESKLTLFELKFLSKKAIPPNQNLSTMLVHNDDHLAHIHKNSRCVLLFEKQNNIKYIYIHIYIVESCGLFLSNPSYYQIEYKIFIGLPKVRYDT